MDKIKYPNIFFLIADHVNKYEDSIIYIAEGLQKLNIPFYSNKNFWLQDVGGEYLFKSDNNIHYSDCDIVIISYTWFEYMDEVTFQIKTQAPPKELFATNRKYKTVYLDPTDGYRTKSWEPYFRQFDLILRAKFNKRTYNPSNVKPWVLGFSERIVKATTNQKSPQERNKVVLQNFNYSHPFLHGSRKMAIEKILPLIKSKYNINNTITGKNTYDFNAYDMLMWEQTSGKHHPEYYNLLGNSMANACFCGELIPGLPFEPSLYLKGGNKAKSYKIFFNILSKVLLQEQRIIQWDSWRFWESLVAGCIPIHLDLEKYGVELPTMPENWKHYVGIDLNNINRDIERFCDDEQKLLEIAIEGRKWVFDNYDQKHIAIKIIKYVS